MDIIQVISYFVEHKPRKKKNLYYQNYVNHGIYLFRL